MLYVMKAIVKKRMVSRKKQKKAAKPKRVSTKSKKSRKPVINSKSAVKNKSNPHRYVKGQSGNLKGRPKGSKNKWSFSEFQKEFEADESKHKGSIYKYFFKRARKNDTVLIALAKKWLPDLKSIEQVTLPADIYTPEEIKDMRKEYRERFG